MAERAGMSALVDFVERLVNDPSNEAHSRDEMQAALDMYRLEARYMPLVGVPTRTGGGVVWLTYDAAVPYWESDATFYDAAYDALTPAAADWTAGRWTFGAEPTAPVTILGWSHDPYQAAADLLEIRAAQLAEQYDFTTGPDSFKRSQKQGQLLALAGRYRAMSPRLRVLETVATLMPAMEIDVFTW
ncbi:MAG: hypothetical protein R3C43_19170 [Chloroflexota bacterium]